VTTRSTREEAAAVLARAIDERRTANARLAARTRVVGFHGEDFEKRWPRVESIVKTHNDEAARAAWEHALLTGWTQAELHRSGLVLGEDT
jgi:predicted ATPase